MTTKGNVGIVGCGNIFDAYAQLSRVFDAVNLVACADIDMEVAEARGRTYEIDALTFDDLLARDDIDAIVNLTNPASHFEVTGRILAAGRHAYSEKPLALAVSDADFLVAEAERRGLLIGAAPDTFLGGAHQTARRFIDEGRLGEIKSGSAHFMNHGHEHWHPNPHPYFQVGAGPVLDMGPYYLTALVNMLGPVRKVVALATTFFEERYVSAKGPNHGTVVPVTTPTTNQALLDFHSGAQIHFSVSYDNWGHGHANPIELHGTKASMMVPDPNFFGGDIKLIEQDGTQVHDTRETPFGHLNWVDSSGVAVSNYRGLGLADLLDAAASGRQPRASGDLARHVVEVLLAIVSSAEEGRFVEVGSRTDRPAPLPADEAQRMMAADAPSVFAA